MRPVAPPLSQIHHLKLPVSDLSVSRDWYQRILGFEVEIEFTEDGELRGLAMTDRARTVRLALRLDSERAAALSGFDPVALAVPTRDDVQAWVEHLDTAGQRHGGVVTGHRGGAVLVGLHDPDGIEVRLYAD
jgi:catechol 2,3-dioxygenase-like lactoylglutathione lyase family enzyme